MGQYRLCVYAICKNESQFVDRWVDSMAEADEIVVLDTGSTDDTVQKLRARGVTVAVEQITPWRFDVARNHALALVPESVQICVCTDLDEVFCPGWRQLVEQAWGDEIQQLRYRYVWSHQPDGSAGLVYWHERIHARNGFRWIHPVHEILQYRGVVHAAEAPGLTLEHFADPEKPRSQYLPLLELAVAEEPNSDRNWHYLGREYLYYGRWDDCIAALEHHLSMPSATWRDERCASMRFLASAFTEKGDLDTAEQWLLRAAAEAPYLREPWAELAFHAYSRQDWDGVVWAARRCLAIRERPKSYVCEASAWGARPWDLLSLGYFNTGRLTEALAAVSQAAALAPWDARLQKNREWIARAAQKA